MTFVILNTSDLGNFDYPKHGRKNRLIMQNLIHNINFDMERQQAIKQRFVVAIDKTELWLEFVPVWLIEGRDVMEEKGCAVCASVVVPWFCWESKFWLSIRRGTFIYHRKEYRNQTPYLPRIRCHAIIN